MRLFLLLFISCVSLFLIPENSFAKSAVFLPKNESSVYRQIDSLNQAAIEAKRYNLKHSFSLLRDAAIKAEKANYIHGLVTNYLYKAEIYQQYGYNHKSLELYRKSLEISLAAADTFNIAQTNNQIGYSLTSSGDYIQGEKYLKNALINYQALKMQEKVVNLINKIGLTKLSQNKLKSAEKCFNKALAASKKDNYWYGEKKANFNLGLLFLEKQDLKKAKAYFNRAYKLDLEKQDMYGLSMAKNKLSYIAYTEKDYAKAVRLAESALQDARKISKTELEIDALHNLITATDKLGNMPDEVRWQKELINIQRQVHEKEDNQVFVFMQLMEEEEEERLFLIEQGIKAQQQATLTHTVLAISIIGICLLSFLAFTLFQNYKLSKNFNAELTATNLEIKNYASKQDELNQTISLQNMSLEENNQMKDKLFSIVSHDLRSPLTSLKGFVNLLERKNLPAEQANQLLSLLSKEVDVVLNMLSNLLDWSRAQLSNTEVTIEPVDLYQMVIENFNLSENLARQKNISLQNNIEAATTVFADKERLNFVIRNLLTNAIKFTYEGGIITVQSRVDDDNIIFSISDNGKGISALNLDKLFNGGKSITTLGTAKEKGTGLGLTLSNDFIKSINGKLNVESIEGEGSTFSVTLPKPDLVSVNSEKEIEQELVAVG